MLRHPINDARAWTAATIDAAGAWYYPLPNVFEQANPDAAACRASLQPVLAALETGRGFAIIEGPQLAARDTQSQIGRDVIDFVRQFLHVRRDIAGVSAVCAGNLAVAPPDERLTTGRDAARAQLFDIDLELPAHLQHEIAG